MSAFWRDLRYAVRRLARTPGFAAVVVLTLALGIGGNTAIFSIVQGVLLRPLPFPRPDRLVMVCETNTEQTTDWCSASPGNTTDWQRLSHSLESIGLMRSWPFSLKSGTKAVGVRGGIATPGAFQAFQVRPEAGRLLEPRDLLPGNEHVAVVSDGFWKTHLGGRPEAVGEQIELDKDRYQVIGILPADFEVPIVGKVDVWIPLWPERQTWRQWRGFVPFGRLVAATTIGQAQAEMETIRSELATEYPETNTAWGVSVESLHERITRPVRPALMVFLVAVGLVLLIACANVANLLLARAFSQSREHAVRLALGANRFQVVRALLGESVVLAVLGGAAGLFLALWAVDSFVGLAPDWFPRLDGVRISGGVLAFATFLSVVTSLLCGLLPALHASDVKVQEALSTGRGGSERRRSRRLSQALVISEVAVAFVLVSGAGLLIRSFATLLDWNPAFDRSNLAVISVFSSPGKYRSADLPGLFERVTAEVSSLPSVVSVGAGSALPLSGGDGDQEYYVEGRPIPPAGQRPTVAWFDVDPRYLQTLRWPLVRGRYFTDEDRGELRSVIVNEALVRRQFAGQDPIGQRLRLLGHEATVELVGVVRDVQPFRPDEAPEPQVYWPFAQAPRWAIQIILRTTGDPARMAGAVRAGIERVDPDLSLGTLRTMSDLVKGQLVDPRFNMIIVAVFAGIALLIAAVGVYGVMAFNVTRQTREIGIRMAMGARRGEILKHVLGQGMGTAAIGMAVGLAGSLALTRWLRSLLVQIEPTDPLTFVAVGLLLCGVAALACYLPARRATLVDPVVVLRAE